MLAETPEELARKFHETYSRVSARMYGHKSEPRPFEELPVKSRELMVAVCAEILGQPVEVKEVEPQGEPVSQEWKEPLKAVEGAETQDIPDWQAEWDREIAEASRQAQRPQRLFSGRVGE